MFYFSDVTSTWIYRGRHFTFYATRFLWQLQLKNDFCRDNLRKCGKNAWIKKERFSGSVSSFAHCIGILLLVVSPHSDHNHALLLVPHSLINADFCCAGSLIAYGALLGKVSPVQLLVVTLFGVTLFAVEEYIILDLLHVSPTYHQSPPWQYLYKRGEFFFFLIKLCDFFFVLFIVQRRWWLHGHSRLRRVLWFGHLLGPVPTKPTPKQAPQWVCLPLGCVCHDWWVTDGFYFAFIAVKPVRLIVNVLTWLQFDCSSLISQVLCSCGCSGPVSTPPSQTTAMDSTEQPSTLTSPSPPLFSPPWPSPACLRREESWTW